MAKTKLLLAFGTHGNEKGGADQGFFKNAIIPFLEEHVAKGKGRAAIIGEKLLPLNIDLSKTESEPREILATMKEVVNTQEIRKMLSDLITRDHKLSSAFLRNVVDKGIPQADFAKIEAAKGVKWPVEVWGYEDHVLLLNRAKPGSVRFYFEPQNADAILLSLCHINMLRLLHRMDDSLEFASERIRVGIRSRILRDMEVIRLADSLSANYPDTPIIIPRGRLHAGMEALFDRQRYDVSLFIGDLGALPFTLDASSRSYGNPFSKHELLLYAQLEVDFNRHMAKFKFGSDLFLDQEMDRVILEARAYAIAKNLEAAAELGIME